MIGKSAIDTAIFYERFRKTEFILHGRWTKDVGRFGLDMR
jgi:hypothetical protein